VLFRSQDADSRRREFILNALLCGLLLAAIAACVIAAFDYFIIETGKHVASVATTLFFLTIVGVLLLVSRRRKPFVASIVLVGFLLITGLQLTLMWGFGLATAELVLALTIVVAGVLFTAPLALAATLVVAGSLIVVTYVQVTNMQQPSTGWQLEPFRSTDVVGYLVIFIMMGLVSWLANRETHQSLQRARRSERALQKERDNLEAKIIERTRELEDLQLARLLEIQPFAEFGRIGASLVHEIANPLTAASLHLEELNKQQHSELVLQVQRNLHHLERYLQAARKQIKRQSKLRVFSVGSETRQVVHLLSDRARRANVRLVVTVSAPVKLYGDAVKFNQLVANLVANAIEASESLSQPVRAEVYISVGAVDGVAEITITDHGIGVPEQSISQLFDSFYTTKPLGRSGLGLGLALVKQYVENDFRGKIQVVSTPETGTVFTLLLKGQERS
jgi:signal transduction histidine kinase